MARCLLRTARTYGTSGSRATNASIDAEERDCTHEGVAQHSVYRDGAGQTVAETVFSDGPPFINRTPGSVTTPASLPTERTERDRSPLGVLPGQPAQCWPSCADQLPSRLFGWTDCYSLWHDRQRRGCRASIRSPGWNAPQAERVATGTETWTATFEDLPDNQRYQPVVRVQLSDGSGRSAVGPLFTLGNPTITVSATFNEHIVAGRIAMQRPPCSAGLGVCDADFNGLFFQFGLNPFALHAASASGPWFVDPTHVPSS